jgi:tol-pal system protein YbgF
MIRSFAVIAALILTTPAAIAQTRDETLADIRQELSVLYVEVQRLKRHLSTTGAPQTAVGGVTPLERIDAIERELQRLTAKAEEIEFNVNQIATRGGNQIGDLEFRLCELEANCDIADLSDGSTLGGVDVGTAPAIAIPTGGAELAVGEQADFDRAAAALEGGDLVSAAEQFATFAQTYPGGPLSAEAHFLRGDALEQLGQTQNAARAYLDSFSTAPNGARAPDALFKVGTTLAALGQTPDACQMFDQVGIRFPGTEAELEARAAQVEYNCL